MKTIILAAAASFALMASAMAATPPGSTLDTKPSKAERARATAIELAKGPNRTSRPSPPSHGKGYSL
ncbi:hypothetical protein LPJGGPFB_02726 [Ensifer adhaerens]|uniref:hypothetical protein n=1 Tax=Ensifer adhaerens TaxID=106592 RepID=UPI00156853D7|nr:hypothetical protein [Ensifer adhaerens]NRP19470.1 hypothetical protein [Ensifer adhaerens]